MSPSHSQSKAQTKQKKKKKNMSKLSPTLKNLINAPFARPGPRAAPAGIRDVYQAIAGEAAQRNLGVRPWLTISAATTFTLNSPDSLPALHSVASAEQGGKDVETAEFIREVGLKCISFNGIPRSINCLNAFYDGLPESITSKLCKKPSRAFTTENLSQRQTEGRNLWDSVYRPFEDKLFDKLAQSHPDLPVHILHSHYSGLLSNPSGDRESLASVGRVLTSLVAISCLRAQTGVGPQVLSHVFGLRKAIGDGSYKAASETESEAAVEWLASEEGSEWILKSVDRIAESIGSGTFAPGGRQSKL